MPRRTNVGENYRRRDGVRYVVFSVSGFRQWICILSYGRVSIHCENSSSCCIPEASMLADLAAACMLLLSIYAQWCLPRQIEGQGRIRLTRWLLLSVGTALGLFAVNFAQLAGVHDTSKIALFLIGF